MEAAPSVQTPPTPDRRRIPRSVLLAAAPLVAATSLPGVAQAQDYQYTGECSLATYLGDKKVYRQFRARFLKDADGSAWAMPGYDYRYTIPTGVSWGPHSDERITYGSGHVAGPENWHSPDDHTSNAGWVAERDWKGKARKGSSVMEVHAWFDRPGSNDPECDVETARF